MRGVARLVVVTKEAGQVAHWCHRCAKLRPLALTVEYVEGRLLLIPVGGQQIHAARGMCLECGEVRPVNPERFPTPVASYPRGDFELLIEKTNPEVLAQRRRLQALRVRAGAAPLGATLEALLGSPRAERLLELAEADVAARGSPGAALAAELSDAHSSVGMESRAKDVVQSVASAYPASAGLVPGLGMFAAVVAVPWVASAPWWAWAGAIVGGGLLARTIIDKLRTQRVEVFVDEVLRPAMRQADLDRAAFITALRRSRNGEPGQSARLQDMEADHALIARCLDRGSS